MPFSYVKWHELEFCGMDPWPKLSAPQKISHYKVVWLGRYIKRDDDDDNRPFNGLKDVNYVRKIDKWHLVSTAASRMTFKARLVIFQLMNIQLFINTTCIRVGHTVPFPLTQ